MNFEVQSNLQVAATVTSDGLCRVRGTNVPQSSTPDLIHPHFRAPGLPQRRTGALGMDSYKSACRDQVRNESVCDLVEVAVEVCFEWLGSAHASPWEEIVKPLDTA